MVYFGDTGTQAVGLLMSAGMPCPPLYSPVEQYMRLIDPSFEVLPPVVYPPVSNWDRPAHRDEAESITCSCFSR